MNPTHIQLVTTPTGKQLLLDGRDLTPAVKRIIIEADAGSATCGVELRDPSYDIDIEGAVVVYKDAELDPVEVILAFLDAVDPETIERMSLEMPDLTTSPAAAIIQALREHVSGGA